METYDIADQGGLHYVVAGLFILAVYLEFMPSVNDAENQYLKEFVKQELLIIACSPLFLLVGMGAIKFLSFGNPPPYWILMFYFIFTFAYYSGYVDNNEEITGGVRRFTIRKAVLIGYLFCHISLYLILFGIFGPFTFDIRGGYRYPSPDALYMVDYNGEIRMVNMAHGYLTGLLYHHAPRWLLFFIMFYVSQLEATASFRMSVYFFCWLFDGIVALVNYFRS